MDGILVINKPKGMTSHDVINFLRIHFHQKKFGHTGTLDPDATGVLVVLCGKSCKLLQFLNDTDKTYETKMKLGIQTSTDDISGEVIASKEINTDFNFEEVLSTFKGKQSQQVPMTSAKKVNGRKLMDYQRKNIEIKPVFQEIEVFDIHALQEELSFEVHCSSGTYVRSLCRDIALKTDNVGTMTELKRTKVGKFSIENAQTLEEIQENGPILYPDISVLEHLPQIELDDVTPVYQGKRIHIESCDAPRVCILDKGIPVAIYDIDQDGFYKSKRGLW